MNVINSSGDQGSVYSHRVLVADGIQGLVTYHIVQVSKIKLHKQGSYFHFKTA